VHGKHYKGYLHFSLEENKETVTKRTEKKRKENKETVTKQKEKKGEFIQKYFHVSKIT
jgi:hypothetical protein